MRVAIILFLIVISGCTATPTTRIIEDQPNSNQMPFIRDGITVRAEVHAQLGEPASTYEDERIVTYWLEKDEAEELVVANTRHLKKGRSESIMEEVGLYDLVLVFDSNGVLERHSFVLIR